ncbi:MAG: DUF11 domain-containing protein [Saprospiraceae bacterium]|nr:DUF11 domain-containing protein [Saprospiraceae bacterium]MBK8849852.1 DUF11 domain-containing protein [Saprospiraceae bacterium]
MNTDQRPVNLDEMLKSYLVNAEAFLATPIKSAKTLLPIGSALLAGINAMDAQIVYSGIQNVSCALAGATARCYANIDQAGGNDFEFHRNHVAAQIFIQIDEVNGGGFTLNGFHGQVAGAYVYPYANMSGVTIGPAGPWGFQAGQANSMSDNGFYPNHKWEGLANGTTRFLGFRGIKGGNTHYGWMRLTKNGFGNYTIVDWAYDNTPNTAIVTGLTASLTADISLVKTVNDNTPNPNQVLTFTLVVSNSGPNPATNLEVTDVVPAGLTYVPGSQTGPGVYVNGSPATIGLKWQNLFIANGGSVVLTFQATATGAPLSSITNFAQVTAILEIDPDSTPNNGNIGEDDGDTETVTINAVGPTASVLTIDDNAICNGQTANLKVQITGGASPYTVVYNDGMSNFNVPGYSSNANIPVSPSSSKTYTLVSVTDNNMVLGTGNSGAPMLAVSNGSATAVLSANGSSSTCPGGTINLKVDIMGGVGPFTVVYSDGMSNFSVPGYISGADIPVMPSAATNYSLVSVTDSYGCAGTGNTGSVMATVGYTTQQNGDFNNPMTWAGGCVPPSTIPVGVTLTILHQVNNTGTLILNGIISTPTGVFTNSGNIKGTGTVIGNFINNGTLSPGS